ncbi:MAG TPA: enolase C-terminal domain-like protein [Mycobacteriales bacterium]|nr:enolase C-terminal domain-like protein [Mycobacteriales bacterium]
MSETISSVTADVYTIDTDRPEADGTLSWNSTTMVTVRVTAGAESGFGWTYGPAACAAVVRDQLAGVVTDRDPLDVTGIWTAMVAAIRNAGRPGVAGYAISAVDTALWDLKARLLRLPLHRLLGAVRDAVPVYGSGGFTAYDEDSLRRQLEGWVQGQRIPRVKIKIGESWGHRVDRDLARMSQARQIIGPGTELLVDANGGYSAKQAIRVMREAEDLDVGWLEEPVSSDDLAGLGQVRDAVSADVAAGEYGCDLVYFRRMVGAVDCLQADITRCGGITEWLRIAAVAAAHGRQISGHCAPHLHAHAAAATPNFRHLEWFHDHVRIENLLFDGVLDPAGGTITPAETPGHGLTFKAVDAEKYRIS